jgi:hypothetical protein
MVIDTSNRKKTMMSHMQINSKQRIFSIGRDLLRGGIFLLVVLVLGALGHWDLALPLFVMALLLGILVLTERLLHRTQDSSHSQIFLGFLPLLYDRPGNPLRRGADDYQIKPAEEDFKPFVFKDHPEVARHE